MPHANKFNRYAWGQEAALYAHFGPVALIHHPQVLADFPADALGKDSIWERIKKTGEGMFYRVEYSKDPKKMDDGPKRKDEKDYVDNPENASKFIDTSIADTPYINNVIEVFVRGNKTEEKLGQLYTEPGEHYE